MAVWILRCLFLVSVAGASYAFINTEGFGETSDQPYMVFLCLLLGSIAVVAADAAIPASGST